MGIIGALIGGSTGDKFGLYRSSVIILALIAGLIALIPITRVFLLVASLYIVYRSVVASFMPLMQSMIANHSPAKNRSLAFSIFSVLVNVGASISPILTSFLAETRGIKIIFPLSVVIIIPSIVLIVFLGARAR